MIHRKCGKCGNSVDLPDDIAPLVDGVGQPLCSGCFDQWRQDNPPPPPTDVAPRPSDKYVYTVDMDEISGFGGGYERTCRNMVIAGLQWFDEHPDAEPQFQGYKGIYGVISESNAAAKLLSDAVVAGADGDCTGAMHQATIGHVLWIHKHGWEAYCTESRKRAKEPHE